MNTHTSHLDPRTGSRPRPGAASAVIRRRCACGTHATAGGECSECAKKREVLQRAATSSEQVESEESVPGIVHDVLRSPGRPLDRSTRAYFEPRFGADFSRVRVHTDAKAVESARAINASAYTAGRDVVFDAGRLAPETSSGRRLLAHELTHVLQQGPVERSASLGMTSPRDRCEVEAERNANAIEHGLPLRATTPPPAPAMVVARDGTVPVMRPPPAVRRPQAVPPPRTAPALRAGPGAPGQPTREESAQRAMAAEYNLTTEEMFERANQAPDADAAREELERPVATLKRGGTAPSFVTVSPQSQTIQIGGGEARSAGNLKVVYKPHAFHVLDAIQNDVAAATSSSQLLDVFKAYFPESVIRFGGTIAGRTDFGATVSLKRTTEFRPQTLDPGGAARTLEFVTAASKKVGTGVNTSLDLIIRTLIQEHDEHEERQDQRRKKRFAEEDKNKPCTTKDVPRKGGSPDQDHHDAYARKVTGADTDFQIVAPDGKTQCTTDGLDRSMLAAKSVWEVKTRHEWATSYGIPGAIFAPYFSGRPNAPDAPDPESGQGRINKIEEQRQRCLDVTDRCGYRYSYAFETKEAYEFMKGLWNQKPPCFHR